MLDYGTGSGVLAVAALQMGAARALGIDCEAQATDLCSATAELNGLSSRFEVSLCSEDVAEVRPGLYGTVENCHMDFGGYPSHHTIGEAYCLDFSQ